MHDFGKSPQAACDPLEVESLRVGDTLEFALTGELDISNASTLRDALDRSLENAARTSGTATQLILDLRSLSFIDSSGIQTLVATKRRCEAQGTRFLLQLGQSQVTRTLDVAGLVEFLGGAVDDAAQRTPWPLRTRPRQDQPWRTRDLRHRD